jgi:hypothetical protein
MLPIIPQDKANHAIYGAIIFCVIFVLSHLSIPHYEIYVASAVVVVAAIAKELRDLWSNTQAKKKNLIPTHGVEAWDAIATIAGGVVVLVPLLCVKYLV